MRPGWVHSGSVGSLKYAMDAVGFIRDDWVHLGAPLESLGSPGFPGFTAVRLGCLRAHPESITAFDDYHTFLLWTSTQVVQKPYLTRMAAYRFRLRALVMKTTLLDHMSLVVTSVKMSFILTRPWRG